MPTKLSPWWNPDSFAACGFAHGSCKAASGRRMWLEVVPMPEHTPLHDITAQAGAVFVDSAGWLVPARYGDPRAEYEQARSSAAVFDLSHRGKVEVSGA